MPARQGSNQNDLNWPHHRDWPQIGHAETSYMIPRSLAFMKQHSDVLHVRSKGAFKNHIRKRRMTSESGPKPIVSHTLWEMLAAQGRSNGKRERERDDSHPLCARSISKRALKQAKFTRSRDASLRCDVFLHPMM